MTPAALEDGMFAELKAYQVGSDAQRDAEIFGDGWVYVGREFDRVVYQRALSTELWCDELESSLGNSEAYKVGYDLIDWTNGGTR